MTLYAAALLIVLAAGLVPALYFTWTFRPARPFSLLNLDAGGWVPVIALLYAWAGVRYVLGMSTPPDTLAEAVLGLGLGVAIDFLLLVRVIHWRRLRRENHPLPYLGPERRHEATTPEA